MLVVSNYPATAKKTVVGNPFHFKSHFSSFPYPPIPFPQSSKNLARAQAMIFQLLFFSFSLIKFFFSFFAILVSVPVNWNNTGPRESRKLLKLVWRSAILQQSLGKHFIKMPLGRLFYIKIEKKLSLLDVAPYTSQKSNSIVFLFDNKTTA